MGLACGQSFSSALGRGARARCATSAPARAVHPVDARPKRVLWGFAFGRLSRQAWPQFIFEEPLTPLRAPARDRAEDPALPVSVPDLPDDFVDAKLTPRRLLNVLKLAVSDRPRLKKILALKSSVAKLARPWR